jgi:hypothetical protein
LPKRLRAIREKLPKPDAQTAFNHIWKKLAGMKDFELSRIDNRLESLFIVELSPRSRLNEEEVLKRRREMIWWIIQKQSEDSGFNSTNMMRDHREQFTKVTNKTVFPEGFGQLFGWARVIERLMEKLDPAEL